jgi:hypothetical protein
MGAGISPDGAARASRSARKPPEGADDGKGSEIIVRGERTEAASGRAGALHIAPRRHAYQIGSDILNLYQDGEIGAVGLAKKPDQSRYNDAESPARSAPGRPEQPTQRRFRLPASYPSARAELERKVSFAPTSLKPPVWSQNDPYRSRGRQGAGIPRSLARFMCRQVHGGANRNHMSVSVLLRQRLRM